MTWAFVARRPIALAIIALAACVTWPALPAVALGLLILRRPDEPPGELAARWIRPVAAAIGAGAAAIACAVALHYLAHPVPPDEKWARIVPRDLLPVTVACLAMWTAAAWYLLAREPRAWSVLPYVRGIADRKLALCGVAAIAIVIARAVWLAYVGTKPGGPTREQFQCEVALESLRGPLWDLVHHVVYYGPIVLVAIGAWRKLAGIAATWGPGAVLAMAMIVAFAIGSESRQWLHLFLFLVAVAIAATAEWWTPRPRRGVRHAVPGVVEAVVADPLRPADFAVRMAGAALLHAAGPVGERRHVPRTSERPRSPPASLPSCCAAAWHDRVRAHRARRADRRDRDGARGTAHRLGARLGLRRCESRRPPDRRRAPALPARSSRSMSRATR
jgi:hypothetical protein